MKQVFKFQLGARYVSVKALTACAAYDRLHQLDPYHHARFLYVLGAHAAFTIEA